VPKPNVPEKKTLVEDFLELLRSLNPNYSREASSPISRPRFDRIYRELSRIDENRAGSFDYTRRRR
jgi:hypothetical protein